VTYVLSISEIDLVILFYFCKVPAVLVWVQCLTNYNVVVHVPAVAVVPSIIDNRVALRREIRVRGASYLLMCQELEGEDSTARKKYSDLSNGNKFQNVKILI
jgi:hypothetical protein